MEVQDHASLEEHDLDRFVEGEVTEPEDEVTRAKAKKGLGKSKEDDEACVGIQTHLGPRNSLVCLNSKKVHQLLMYFQKFRVSGIY